MPELFEKALDLALEMKDPQRKLERRRKREAARSKTRLDEAAGAKKREASRREGHERFRYTPSSVRERLFERADYPIQKHCRPSGVGSIPASGWGAAGAGPAAKRCLSKITPSVRLN